jgi:hypothetical protein
MPLKRKGRSTHKEEGEIFKISMYSYAGMALPGLSPCLADATLREANMRLSKDNLN